MAHIVEERSEAKADKKRLNRGTRILRNIVIVIVVIALLLGAAVFVLDHFGRSKLTDDAAEMTVIDDAELDNAGRVRYKGQLYEELLLSGEGMEKTKNDLIYIGHEIPFDFDVFEEQLDQFRRLKESYGTNDILRKIIREVVPTYHEPQEDISAKEAALVQEMASV